MSRNGNRSRTPLSPALRAQLTSVREAQSMDTCVLVDSRPVREPYWTTKGLVLSESRTTISYWDERTRTRKTKSIGRYRPQVVTGPWVEELRQRNKPGARSVQRKRRPAAAESRSRAKSKKGKSP